MGQGTITGTGGRSRSKSTQSMTGIDEREEHVLNRRLLDGMQAVTLIGLEPARAGTTPSSQRSSGSQADASQEDELPWVWWRP
jgi:hypothetical protein